MPSTGPIANADRSADRRPTSIRHRVLLVTILAAVGLYLVRTCIATILRSESLAGALEFDGDDEAWIKSAFFWSYAIAQIPAGWICDRFGARRMMTVYILGWSACAALLGCATGFGWFIAMWFAVGILQAGAYPTASSLLRRWFPLESRGLASSLVALGGRIGGAAAPKLTGKLLSAFAAQGPFAWRLVFWLYAAFGALVALVYWKTCRNRPQEHASVNQAELASIGSAPEAVSSSSGEVVLREFVIPALRNRSLWLMCACQFTTVVGWVFLVNNVPDFLKARHGKPAETVTASAADPNQGAAFRDVSSAADKLDQDELDTLASVPLFVGIAGMFLGGVLTDRLVRAWGLRKGRVVHLALSRLGAAGAFFACLCTDSPYVHTAAFALVAFSTDLGVGATWAYAQDAGGKYVGAILGWGNMFGNFGAAISPLLIQKLCNANKMSAPQTWDAAFVMLGVSFILSGLFALGIDPTRTVPKTAEE